MATRTNSLESKILAALTEWESSAESPATLQEVMGEFGTTDKETYDALGALEDAGKVTSDGRWLTSVWFLGKAKEATPAPAQDKPKRTRRTKAQMAAARAEEANRTRYAANVAESQDGDMQHATPRVVDAEPKGDAALYGTVTVIPAETPVIAQSGETVTVPVDYDNPSAGRRELDASQGERVLSEDTYRVRKTPARSDESRAEYVREMEALRATGNMNPDSIRALIRTLQGMVNDTPETEVFTVTYHEPKNGECPGNEIPPLPQGVNPNTWELAHDANTQGARDYWKRVATRQAEEYAARMSGDVPPF